MTATATPYLNLPPTFNALDPFQRARFVRTTRKLGHVLGTTPTLLGPSKGAYERHDLNEFLPIGPKSNGSGGRSVTSSSSKGQSTKSNARSTRRHGSLFNIPISLNSDASRSSSSLSSMSSQASSTSTSNLRETKSFSASRRRKADAPVPLVLQLNADRVKKVDAELSTNAKLLNSPISPFAAFSNTFEHRRSRSGSIPLSSGTGFGTSVPTPLTPSFRLRATAIPAHRRQKLQKLARTLGENIPPSLVFPALSHPALSDPASSTPECPKSLMSGVVRMPKTPTSVSTARGRRRSASAGSLYPLIADVRLPPSVPPKNAKGASRWEPPTDWTVDPKDRLEQDDDELRGMWSDDDYDSVMLQLRALRK